MSFVVHEDVLGLQVPINSVQLLMEVLQREEHLRRVEGRNFLGEDLILVEVFVKIAPLHVVHHIVQSGFVLEGEVEVDDEGMLTLHKNEFFGEDTLLRLLFVLKFLLFEDFHGVELPTLFHFYFVHFAESSLADPTQKIEVGRLHVDFPRLETLSLPWLLPLSSNKAYCYEITPAGLFGGFILFDGIVDDVFSCELPL